MAKPKPTADIITDIEQAQRAVQSGLVELLEKQELKVLQRLVGAYYNDKLTDRDAAVGIAIIAENRRFVSSLERIVRQGIESSEQLTRRAI